LPPKEQRSGLGRRLAVGIYSVALAYLVLVGFVSVIPQVFWPESDDSFDPECAEGLKMLHDEVDRLRLSYLGSSETDPTALRDALDSWDRRLSALAKRCNEDQVHLLNRYRHRVELSVRRSMREDAPIAKRVTEAIQPTPDMPGLDPSEPVR
jgi:hypothetical protein